MDTTVTYDNMHLSTDNYIKITISRLYRVNGTTAQFKGVQPDILLPDILDAYAQKEANEPFALRPNTIEANKYYQPDPPLPLKALAAGVQHEIDTSKYFNAIKSIIAYSKKQKAIKDIPLDLKGALANADPMAKDYDNMLILGNPSKKYSVRNNQYEMARLQADSNLKDMNEEFSKRIATDADVSIAYDVTITIENTLI